MTFDINKYFSAHIFAGGLGTRLKPLTDKVPKPMVIVHNRPLVSYANELLNNIGITHITANVTYGEEQFKASEYLKNIHFIKEELPPKGQGVELAEAFKHTKKDHLIACNGDTILNIDTDKLLEAIENYTQIQNEYKLHMLLYNSDRNTLIVDSENNILGAKTEKDQWTYQISTNKPTKQVDYAGICIISRKAAELVNTNEEFGGFFHNNELLERIGDKKGSITGFYIPNLVKYEVTTPEDLEEINRTELSISYI